MSSGNDSRCPFTGGACDKGRIYPDGSVGCGFWNGGCAMLDAVPDGETPRDFYNRMVMEAMRQ